MNKLPVHCILLKAFITNIPKVGSRDHNICFICGTHQKEEQRQNDLINSKQKASIIVCICIIYRYVSIPILMYRLDLLKVNIIYLLISSYSTQYFFIFLFICYTGRAMLLTLSNIFLPAMPKSFWPMEKHFCHLIMSEISKLKYNNFSSKHLKQFIKMTTVFQKNLLRRITVLLYVTLSLRKSVPFPPLLKFIVGPF